MSAFPREFDQSVSRFLTPVVKWLVYVCVAVYVLEIVGLAVPIVRYCGASAGSTILGFELWQLVTYMFVHDPVMVSHLLFNLLSLWMLGCRLEERWGSERFARFVLVAGAGAVLFHLLVTLSLGRHFETIIGISGVIYGILVVYWKYWPNDVMYFQMLIPMKVKHVVLIIFVIEFLSAPVGASSGVARLTHLGGGLLGYLFVRFPDLFDRIPVPTVRRRRRFETRGRWTDL